MRNIPALLLAFISLIPTAVAAVYHLDAVSGDDAANGLDPQHAWRSLEKANATELKPGDQLLFKAGGRGGTVAVWITSPFYLLVSDSIVEYSRV